MATDQLNEEVIFNTARKIESAEARAEYLDQVCGGDDGLRTRVEELLRAYINDTGQLELSAAPVSPTIATAPVVEKPGAVIGKYKLLQQIGEGGFGVVFMAEQQKPVRRKVAIKIIKPGMDTKEVVARFEAERQALALMDHPNIARVLDAGETESGRPYFAMDLVKGVPLTEFCNTNKLSSHERLDLFVTICRAIQHAHQKGIIHRDLKPSNVMVTLHDNKPVPKIIDFGVSKAISQQLTEKTLFTAYGQMVGTPTYMSPEQAQMSGLDIDTRSDVYSLGVILYELMTGTTPLDAERLRSTAYVEMQRLIAEEEAPKPSTRLTTLGEQQAKIAQQRDTDPKRLRQFLAGDLDWIVMKALDKERNRRYESASSFAEDIERFLSDDAIVARPPSTAYKFRKFVRRNRGPAIAAAALLAVLLLGLAGTSIGLVSAKRQAERALTEQGRARHEADRAQFEEQKANAASSRAKAAEQAAVATSELKRRQLYVANMQLADQLWNSSHGSQREVEELLAAWIPTDSQPDLREFSWRYQWSRLYGNAANMVLDSGRAAVAPDGNLVTAGAMGIRKWQHSGDSPAQIWGGDASQAVLSPNGRVAAIPTQSHLQLLDVDSGRAIRRLPGYRCAFAFDGRFIATWGVDTPLQVWNVDSGEGVTSFQSFAETGLPDYFRPPNKVEQESEQAKHVPNHGNIALAPDGKSFLLLGHPRSSQVTAFIDGRAEPVTWSHRNSVHSCAWSPDGQVIASASYTGKLVLRLTNDPLESLVTGTHGRPISVLRFSPDSMRLASGGSDGAIDIWDLSAIHRHAAPPDQADAKLGPSQRIKAPKLIHTIKAHLGGIRSLAFSSDGQRLASSDGSGVCKLWDFENRKSTYVIEQMAEDLLGGRVGIELERVNEGVRITKVDAGGPAAESGKIHEGDELVGVSDDKIGDVMDFTGMDETAVYFLTRGSFESAVRLHIKKGDDAEPSVVELKRNIKQDPRSFRVAYHPNGKSLAVADSVGAVSWTIGDTRMRRYPTKGISVAFSPDERLLAMVSYDGVHLWDLRTDRLYATLDGRVKGPIPENGHGGSIAFSPDGKYLALGTGYSYNSKPKRSDLKVWEIAGLKEIGEPLHKSERVMTYVVFSPDGRWLLAADHGGSVRVWDTSTWTLERTLQVGHVAVIAVSPDGRLIATGGRTGGTRGVELWDFESGKRIRFLGGHNAFGLAFSPDGRTLVSTGQDHVVLLWDVDTGMRLRSFYAHTDGVCGVAFAPDGNTLATAGTEGTLRLWEAAPFEEIDQHPLTLRAMFRLGLLQTKKLRYAAAEATLRQALRHQQEVLPSGHVAIDKTRAAIVVALKGQDE